jgi:hypothetical protein
MDKQSRSSPGLPLTAERKRALRMLTRSPDGCTEAILLAYGFKIEMLAGLLLDGLATAAPETVPAGRRQFKVVRLMITDAGRGVITERR